MKFIFVAPRYHTNQQEIVRVLQDNGHDVAFHVHTIGPTEDHTNLVPTVFKACLLSRFIMKLLGPGGDSTPRHFPDPFGYLLTLRSKRPDVLILRGFSLFSLVAAFAGRIVGAKIIFYVQMPLTPPYKLLKRYLSALIISVFDAVVYTPLLGLKVPGASVPRNWHFVPFAVKFHFSEKQQSSETRLLMIGKFYKRKNQILLIDAISKLQNEFKLKLTIVGECVNNTQHQVLREVKHFIKQRELGDIVKIQLNVPFLNITQYYVQNDIFILPATDEPASISVLEAMACGIPVICSDSCGTRGYVNALRGGLIFKSDDSDSLTEILRIMLRDNERLKGMQRSIRRNATTLISGNAYYRNLTLLLKNKWGINIQE